MLGSVTESPGAAQRAIRRARRQAAKLPEPVKRRPRAVVSRLERAWTYDLRWPAPWWHLTGHGWLELGGHRFRFEQIGQWPHAWWARRVRDGVWEREVIAFFAQTIRPGDTVLDIGAYVGPHALLASRLVGAVGQVYAFEPDPVARALLHRNVVANDAGNVTILPWAVADKLGPVWLDSSSLGGANTVTSRVAGLMQVPAVKLTSFCEQLRLSPAVIKIDVEGGEAEIVTEEAMGILRDARAVVIEVHEAALAERGIELEEFISRCKRTGKSVAMLDKRVEGNFNIALS